MWSEIRDPRSMVRGPWWFGVHVIKITQFVDVIVIIFHQCSTLNLRNVFIQNFTDTQSFNSVLFWEMDSIMSFKCLVLFIDYETKFVIIEQIAYTYSIS